LNKKIIQGNKTKKRIIDCARRLFMEKGYNNVTVDEIIAEVNSSKGGFYTHFKTKEDLIYGMLPIVDEAYSSFFKKEGKYENTIEKIFALINYVFYIMENDIGLEFMSVIYSSQIKDLTTYRFLTAPEREYYKQLKILIEDAHKNRELTADIPTEEIISILTTCIRGVIYDWCLNRGSFQLSLYGMKIIKIMLDHFKPNS